MSIKVDAQYLQSAVGFLAEDYLGGGDGWKSRLSSGRLVKRACGLCECLTGALLEVKSIFFRCLSNPVYPYVNVCNLVQVMA